MLSTGQAERRIPTLIDFLPDKACSDHFKVVSQFYLIEVLNNRYGPIKKGAFSIPPIHPLEPEVTETHPLPVMAIPQSSIDGNLKVVETIVLDFFKLKPDFFDNKNAIVAGDQLTISRMRSAQDLREPDLTRFHRMEWAVPMLQLFHLQMAFCKMIVSTHYGTNNNPESLRSIISLLGRSGVSKDEMDYHTAYELLRHTYDAMVRRLWSKELGQDPRTFMAQLKLEKEKDAASIISNHAKNLYSNYFSDSAMVAQNYGNTDANAALFIRDTTAFLELCAAIKAGDVGRIEQVLSIITVMFQAGGAKNYANELMRLTYAIRCVWTETTKDVMFKSWLVNTKGEEDSFLATDLHQEHNNKLIKGYFTTKGGKVDFANVARLFSTNIRTFEALKEKLGMEYEKPHNSTFHSTVSAESDISVIVNSLARNNILGEGTPGNNNNVNLVRDLLKEGMCNLTYKRAASFIQKISDENGRLDGEEEDENENDDNEGHIRYEYNTEE
ncbi:hypothetical protein BGZ49_005055 [Haplosporangium sp. Z 27]|nr:hypothetical protein BGZ49_005055 [Haplosporangium sp. Z 27]